MTTHTGQREIRVKLSPEDAKIVADDLQFQFSSKLEPYGDSDGSRDAVAELRQFLGEYESLLDQLHWGEAREPVTFAYLEDRMVEVSESLYRDGADRVGQPDSYNDADPVGVRRQGLAMIQTADVIHAALNKAR